MMKRIFFLIVIFYCSSCAVDEEKISNESLEKALNEFNAAFESADLKKLESMLATRYVHTNSSWKSFGKDKWLGYMKNRKDRIESGELSISSYEMDELAIELYNKSAIVTGRIISEGLDQGVPFKSEIRVTNFWVMEEGSWKRAGFHDTRIETN